MKDAPFYEDSYFIKLGDHYHDKAYINSRDLARFLVNTFNPGTSLDLGCAYGFNVHWLRHFGVEAHGVDISDYALTHGVEDIRQYLYNVNLTEGRLPFQNNTIDIVTAFQLVEHIEDLSHLLKEVYRILKPNGYLFVTTPIPFIDSKLGQFLLGKGWKRLDTTHVNVQSRKYWTSYMKKYGFVSLGACPEVISASVPEYWVTRALSKIPGINNIRAYFGGVYLFQRV
ncbi:class I SAM-dependent methyltransferase [Chloroflexota bacterium]